jgi:hypothetical protein
VSFWEELKGRVRQVDDENNLVGGLSYGHVRDRTSLEIDTGNEATIFDETIKFYTKRKESARVLLVNALVETHQTAFRPYLSRPQWSMAGSDGASKWIRPHILVPVADKVPADVSPLAVTAELDEPLRVSPILTYRAPSSI